jgi:DNA-directed RNA polymerase subunit M/transcription elongation factor TFIIS
MIEFLQTMFKNKASVVEESVYSFIKDQHNGNRVFYVTKIQQLYHMLQFYDIGWLLEDDKKLAGIATLEYKTLCPDKWNLLQTDLAILEEKILENNNIYTTNAFICGVCGLNKCIYSEVQVRSCDENATVFVRCTHCGNCFKG